MSPIKSPDIPPLSWREQVALKCWGSEGSTLRAEALLWVWEAVGTLGEKGKLIP